MANSERRNAWLRAWCKRNPEKRFLRYFRHRLKKKYGLTPGHYKAILASQNGCCQICKIKLQVPTAEQRVVRNGNCAVVDHIKSKVGMASVRGILCNNCNRALGLFKDSPEIMKVAAYYVERNNRKSFLMAHETASAILRELDSDATGSK